VQAEQPEFSISKQTLADCDVISLMSARLDGREVILVCPDGNVSRVLEIVQIGRQIAVYPALDDPLAARDRHGRAPDPD